MSLQPSALPPASDTAPFHVGPWRLDPAARTASDGERVRQLSPRAVGVLCALAQAHGDVVSRRALLKTVWPTVTVGDDSLTQAIAELRRAFGDKRAAAQMIETVAKSGYRLRAPVRFDTHDEAPSADGADFDMTAYLLCMEGRQEMIRSGPDALERIEQLAEEAAARCPRFALAKADLAVALTNRGLFRPNARGRLLDAVAVAEDAVALRPDLGYTHAAHGFVLGALDRFEAASAAFAKAFSRDPGDGEAHYLAARTAFVSRDHRASVILAHRTAELSADGSRSLLIAARAAMALDRPTRVRYAAMCRARLDAALADDPHSTRYRQALAPTLAMVGEGDAARDTLDAGAGVRKTLGYHTLLARVLLGDIDVALDHLEELIDAGWRDGTGLASEPIIWRLSAEPRYRRIVSALN